MRRALILLSALAASTSAMAADGCNPAGPGQICNRTAKVGGAAPGASQDVVAECPAGMFATGGGFLMSASPQKFTVTQSAPFQNGRAWAVTAVNTTSAPQPSELTAFAVCRQ